MKTQPDVYTQALFNDILERMPKAYIVFSEIEYNEHTPDKLTIEYLDSIKIVRIITVEVSDDIQISHSAMINTIHITQLRKSMIFDLIDGDRVSEYIISTLHEPYDYSSYI